MSKKFTLYWSNLKNYQECPRKFLWYRGWEDIDLGAGPGNSKPKPEEFSKHDSLMGIVIQKVIELMYNNELWKNPSTLRSTLESLTKKHFELELADSYIDWKRAPAKVDMFRTCLDGVFGYLSTFKYHKLVGSYARAEKDLYAYINDYVPIGGRVDLIVKREDTGVTIVDGKNSKHKAKYLDPDQLRWYALCFYLCYGKIPDRLGWVYYRFPYGMEIPGLEEKETGVEWVEFCLEDLKGLANRALGIRKDMDKRKFEATPSPGTCRFCEYQSICQERIEQKELNKKKRTKKEKPLPKTESTGFGFEEF